MRILVLGSGGQLGKCLKDQLKNFKGEVFLKSRLDLDIFSFLDVEHALHSIKPNIVINASAYTNVDQAEDDYEKANSINNTAVKNIADCCFKVKALLVHISTDYVFDGNAKKPYKNSSITNPQGVYGATKRQGELQIVNSECRYIIIRTAWLFSEYNSNFLKTILNLGLQKNELSIIGDQLGCPTYAQDLAKAIVTSFYKIESENLVNNIYHYSGNQQCSWFEFTQEIFKIAKLQGFKIKSKVKKISTSEYKTQAKRPMYSVLDSSEFCKAFEVQPSNWHDGIKSSLSIISECHN